MFTFKTVRTRVATAIVLGIIGVVPLFSFLPYPIVGVVRDLFFATFLILASIIFFFFSSTEEKEVEKDKELHIRINSNVVILADAIVKTYPNILQSDSIQNTMKSLHTMEIMHKYVLPAVLHRIDHDRYCLFSKDCERNSENVSKGIRLTLAILAKKFSDAADTQKRHQEKIDRLVQCCSFGEVDTFFTEQEVLDAEVNKKKEDFWRVHAAAKAIGEKVYPKIRWYILLWYPELQTS